MEMKVKTFSARTLGIMDENEKWHNISDMLNAEKKEQIAEKLSKLTRGSIIDITEDADGYTDFDIKHLSDKIMPFKKERDDYIGFEALLEQVHKNKDISIETEMLRTNEGKSILSNGYVFKATIKSGKNTFTGHGDADPTNTTSTTKDAMIRFAETRAIARACRMALGIGMTAKEELNEN